MMPRCLFQVRPLLSSSRTNMRSVTQRLHFTVQMQLNLIFQPESIIFSPKRVSFSGFLSQWTPPSSFQLFKPKTYSSSLPITPFINMYLDFTTPSKYFSNLSTSPCLYHEHCSPRPQYLTLRSFPCYTLSSPRYPHSTHPPCCSQSDQVIPLLKIFCWLPSALQINRRILNEV